VHAGLQWIETGRGVGGVGIVEWQWFLFEIEHVHGGAVRAQMVRHLKNHRAGDRRGIQTPDDGEDLKRLVRHPERLAAFAADATVTSSPETRCSTCFQTTPQNSAGAPRAAEPPRLPPYHA